MSPLEADGVAHAGYDGRSKALADSAESRTSRSVIR